MTYQTVDPATGEVIKCFDTVQDAELDSLIELADAQYRQWRRTSIDERAALLRATAQLYRDRKQELAEIIATEMGKPVVQGAGEIAVSADIYDYYADNVANFMSDKPLDVSSGGRAVVRTEPIGVLLGIMPWNYPYYQVARFAAPNLALGNTILLKHAPQCAQSALAIEEIFADAGLPRGAYLNVFATNEQVSDIIADSRVQGISLTGSERAGSAVAEQAGRHLKKVVLELGGSDPFIVLDDTDLDQTIKAAVSGRFSNAGQACTSPKRFIVMESFYERFADGVAAAVRELSIGNPLDRETRMGPMSSVAARDGLAEQVNDAVQHGATVLAGGAVGSPGAHFEPTVLADITPSMRAWSEELFGPVAQIFQVSSVDEAIDLANDSPYGLGAAVFGADDELNQYVAERLEVGMVFIGGNTDSEPDLPFGGVKRSGFGRELGEFGFTEFANKKLIRTVP